MPSNPGGADHAELRAGVLTLILEQPEPWPESDPTEELIARIGRCLKAIESDEVRQFAPGAESFRITVIYHHDPPQEVRDALERVKFEQQNTTDVAWHSDRPG
jgi:hypothetical protein